MNARTLAVLVALLVLIGGAAVYYYQQQGRTTTVESLGKPLLPGLKAADIESIAIREAGGTLTLVRKDSRWTLAERGGFPADATKVREFVLKALELKIGQNEPLAASDRQRLQLSEPAAKEGGATEVQFKGKDGKALATLLVGKKYFKGAAPDNVDRAPGDGRFVAVPSAAGRVYIVSDPLAQASAKSAAWIVTDGIAVSDPVAVEMQFRDGERWRVHKEPKGSGEWKLEPLKPGEKAEQSKLSSAAYGLYELKLADVAPPDLKPVDAGLEKPITLSATDQEGVRYTLRLGKPREADATLYANVSVEGAIRIRPRQAPKNEKPDDKDKAKWDKEWAERQAKMQERIEREKTLANYTVLLPLKSLNDVLKRRDELLDKNKEPAKK